MAASKNGPNPLVSVGESCQLVAESQGITTFRRLLVKPDEGGRKIILLFKENQDPQFADEKMRALQPLSFQAGQETTKDEIDEAFANCPCKDPANQGLDIGATGCLAINSLLER
ncbi:MAG TPA: hypothetical protein VG964_01110 [Candidatus Saccharimonadales bacterium]|nr:hypothetical protein [Candidatus Saccharimonadales bacterium]